MSILYIVSTPIGNLEDTSFRAVRILKEVTLIAAEDTRHTRKLLSHFDIHTPLTSYYEHNKEYKIDAVMNKLEQGNVALVSDAGTPTINDPGYLLVQAAIKAGHIVTSVPGPSAPIAALSLSGIPSDSFLYLGYLARKSSERKDDLRKVATQAHTLVFFETPHRLLESLADILEVLGNRQTAVASEITKMYEDVFRGNLKEAISYFEKYPARGEFTLVIAGAAEYMEEWSQRDLDEIIKQKLSNGDFPSNIAKEMAQVTKLKRRDLYQRILEIQTKD
ncbi:MAG: 16S rRNA (cytidine(1402)-2'-O)-methyltransferase [Anaerolineales bacterium]|nr:16S rRNA (cytidine(1402)-2'-O)-methyltransferase [Anaerolineales bacterium]